MNQKEKLIQLAKAAKEQNDKSLLTQAMELDKSLKIFSEEEKIKYFVWNEDKQWHMSGFQKKLEAIAKKYGKAKVVFHEPSWDMKDIYGDLDIKMVIPDAIPYDVMEEYSTNPAYGHLQIWESPMYARTGKKIIKLKKEIGAAIERAFKGSELYKARFIQKNLEEINTLDYDAEFTLMFELTLLARK